MAQHILIKDEYIKELLNKALKDKSSLKWNVEKYNKPRERINLHWLKTVYEILISKEQLNKAEVYFIEIWKPITKLKKLLQEDESFHFEVFEFPNKRVVFWVI